MAHPGSNEMQNDECRMQNEDRQTECLTPHSAFFILHSACPLGIRSLNWNIVCRAILAAQRAVVKRHDLSALERRYDDRFANIRIPAFPAAAFVAPI